MRCKGHYKLCTEHHRGAKSDDRNITGYLDIWDKENLTDSQSLQECHGFSHGFLVQHYRSCMLRCQHYIKRLWWFVSSMKVIIWKGAWCAHPQQTHHHSRARSSSSSSSLTCAVLPFAFALSALWVIRRTSLRQVEQQRQQAGGHQVPDNPAGTPGTPPRAWHHDDEDDPTSRHRLTNHLVLDSGEKACKLFSVIPVKRKKTPRLPHAVSRWRKSTKGWREKSRESAEVCGEDGGMCRELLAWFRVQEASEAVRFVQGGRRGGSGSILAIRSSSAPKLRVFLGRFI